MILPKVQSAVSIWFYYQKLLGPLVPTGKLKSEREEFVARFEFHSCKLIVEVIIFTLFAELIFDLLKNIYHI